MYLSASVCCSLMPTLKSTGWTRSSIPLWSSRGRASNKGPGRGIRTLKPSLERGRGGGRGGTGNGHTTQEHLLASAGESGLALFRDFLTASHRPERGVKLCYRLQLAFLMECNTAKQERRVCAHDEHQLKFWASSENQKNVSTDFL